MTWRTILIDPPWPQVLTGRYKRRRHSRPLTLPYPTMTLDQIAALPIASLAEPGSHLWLWTTNQFLQQGLNLMQAWGFKYLAPIHWLKPSGMGNYFIHRTQTLLFGYYEKCQFNKARYLPNLIEAGTPLKHSTKPEESYQYIESISDEPRIELFARQEREGWTVTGNEVTTPLPFGVMNPQSSVAQSSPVL